MNLPTAVPLPAIDDLTRPFWDGCMAGRLLFQQCRACGAFQPIPRVCCRECRGRGFDWVESAGTGRVFSFTIAHRSPLPALDDNLPYNIIVVQLDDCGGPLLVSNLVGQGEEEPVIGRQVDVCFDEAAGIALPRFHYR